MDTDPIFDNTLSQMWDVKCIKFGMTNNRPLWSKIHVMPNMIHTCICMSFDRMYWFVIQCITKARTTEGIGAIIRDTYHRI